MFGDIGHGSCCCIWYGTAAHEAKGQRAIIDEVCTVAEVAGKTIAIQLDDRRICQ